MNGHGYYDKKDFLPFISSMGMLVYGDAFGYRTVHITMLKGKAMHGRLPNKVID